MRYYFTAHPRAPLNTKCIIKKNFFQKLPETKSDELQDLETLTASTFDTTLPKVRLFPPPVRDSFSRSVFHKNTIFSGASKNEEKG